MKLRYLVLECGYDSHIDIWEQEEKYGVKIIELDKFEETEIHHNPYYMILGTEEKLSKWIKECYTYDEFSQVTLIQNMKELEE